MHIVLLVTGIVVLVVAFVLVGKSEQKQTVGPARGMWSGTLGDLMSGEPTRSKTTTKTNGKIMGLGCLTFLISLACFYGAWRLWP